MLLRVGVGGAAVAPVKAGFALLDSAPFQITRDCHDPPSAESALVDCLSPALPYGALRHVIPYSAAPAQPLCLSYSQNRIVLHASIYSAGMVQQYPW